MQLKQCLEGSKVQKQKSNRKQKNKRIKEAKGSS